MSLDKIQFITIIFIMEVAAWIIFWPRRQTNSPVAQCFCHINLLWLMCWQTIVYLPAKAEIIRLESCFWPPDNFKFNNHWNNPALSTIFIHPSIHPSSIPTYPLQHPRWRESIPAQNGWEARSVLYIYISQNHNHTFVLKGFSICTTFEILYLQTRPILWAGSRE